MDWFTLLPSEQRAIASYALVGLVSAATARFFLVHWERKTQTQDLGVETEMLAQLDNGVVYRLMALMREHVAHSKRTWALYEAWVIEADQFALVHDNWQTKDPDTTASMVRASRDRVKAAGQALQEYITQHPRVPDTRKTAVVRLNKEIDQITKNLTLGAFVEARQRNSSTTAARAAT
jgi:hypothetical protein